MKLLTTLLLIVLIAPSFAQDYDLLNQKLTDLQKEDAVFLEKNLMATCCFGGPVYMHGKNQMTEDAKVTIRKLLVEGKSRQEILDHFRASVDPRTQQHYGNRILASPIATETVGKVSYWMVPVFFLIGLGLLTLAIRKLRTGSGAIDNKQELPSETVQQIEDELSELK
jgi:cytochrome c-type biogenesis protein CcmH/NrfF